MKKKILTIILCSLLLLGLPLAAAASEMQESSRMSVDVGISFNIAPVIVSADVQITSSIEIDPNARERQDIIKPAQISMVNRSNAPVDIIFETITYGGMDITGSGIFEPIQDGPDIFAGFGADRYVIDKKPDGDIIFWELLKMEETHRVVAFAFTQEGKEPMDMIPGKSFKVCTLASRFDEENARKELDIGMKAGYAWGVTHAKPHKYNIVLIVSLSEEGFKA